VQLRWTIADLAEPGKILSEGTAPFANVWVEANSSKMVEIPTTYPRVLFKSLAGGGEVNGRFRLTLAVQEARFDDGSLRRRADATR